MPTTGELLDRYLERLYGPQAPPQRGPWPIPPRSRSSMHPQHQIADRPPAPPPSGVSSADNTARWLATRPAYARGAYALPGIEGYVILLSYTSTGKMLRFSQVAVEVADVERSLARMRRELEHVDPIASSPPLALVRED